LPQAQPQKKSVNVTGKPEAYRHVLRQSRVNCYSTINR
jgi:hypothetical protein